MGHLLLSEQCSCQGHTYWEIYRGTHFHYLWRDYLFAPYHIFACRCKNENKRTNCSGCHMLRLGHTIWHPNDSHLESLSHFVFLLRHWWKRKLLQEDLGRNLTITTSLDQYWDSYSTNILLSQRGQNFTKTSLTPRWNNQWGNRWRGILCYGKHICIACTGGFSLLRPTFHQCLWRYWHNNVAMFLMRKILRDEN